MTREWYQKNRHEAEYDDPMVTGRRSNSGKLEWECQKCGRITSGCERECYTLAMMTPEQIQEWAMQLREHLMPPPERGTMLD